MCMNKAERAKKIEELMQKISKLESIIAELNMCRTGIELETKRLEDDVMEPIRKYELEGGDNKEEVWRGRNEMKAEEGKEEIKSSLCEYEEDCINMVNQINKAIKQVKDKIEKYRKEIASLNAA